MRRVWALADTHLSFANPKPMDVFGDHWRDHPARIAEICAKLIEPGDLLLMPGDISWALKRADALLDLAWIANLPGTKVLCKGNHDYWWDSDRPLDYPGLFDTPFRTDDDVIGVAGTRGWIPVQPDMTDDERGQCEKIVRRETARLSKRLALLDGCGTKIAMIHYPPLEDFVPVLRDHGVETVLYGHLHLGGKETPPPEDWRGMRALCVACDRIRFIPRLVGQWE